MGCRLTDTIDAPIDEVFAWHERPGALARLLPPWLPLRVLRESSSLADGTTVLGLPLGLRWIAKHQPGGYQAGRRFEDVLATPIVGDVVPWRHIHEFRGGADGHTEITDTVETPVPGALIRETLTYRGRQLNGDLAAHRMAAAFRATPMTVAITGSSGTVGSALSAMLLTGGHRVIHMVRRASRSTPEAGPEERSWNPEAPVPNVLDGVDAVVHLAGQTIAGRFSEDHKRAIRDSRLGPTARLAELVSARGVPVFVSASAIGFYGPQRGDEVLTESSARGDGFLADVVDGWEAAGDAARQGGARTVQVRTGIVQTPRGGVLKLQRPLFEIGAGGRLGRGDQWFSWIGIDDLLDVYLRALADPTMQGPVNAVAPEPVRNSEYAATLARVLHRPALLPVPALGPKILLGSEGAREIAEASQRVAPTRLNAAGHEFRHPDLESALRHVLGRGAANSESDPA
jgi:uncharacterized protein (TIGR01777 family)